MKKYGKPTIPEFQRYYKAAKQCDEAPIIFVLNKPFRSRAVTLDFDSTTRGEMSLLSSEYDQRTIIHELLHQFGAVDLYYPQEVHNLIQSMRYDSIMAISHSMNIDSLSAYLIGWTNWLDAPAVKILDRTKHLTRDDIIKAINREYGRA